MKTGWNIRMKDGTFLLMVWVSKPVALEALRYVKERRGYVRPGLRVNPAELELYQAF